MLPEFINLFKDEIENNKKYKYIEDYFNERWRPLEKKWESLEYVTKKANIYNKKSEDDGYLTSLEISKLNWEGVDLVVIAGCQFENELVLC